MAIFEGKLVFIDFGMMSEILEEVRFVIIGYVVYMVNCDYEVMVRDYYVLDFLLFDVDIFFIVFVF